MPLWVMMGILLTQKAIKTLMRGEAGRLGAALREGFSDLIEGMIAGARNMIGIAVATGAAGIIVATVTRTPIGTELAGLVELLSAGNLFIMLVLVGVFSLILGLGLPTTANYIVVFLPDGLGRRQPRGAGGPHRAADRGASLRVLISGSWPT